MKIDPEVIDLTLITLIVLVIFVVDFVLAKIFTVYGTFSQYIRRKALKYPFLPLFVGLSVGALMGHFFLCPVCE